MRHKSLSVLAALGLVVGMARLAEAQVGSNPSLSSWSNIYMAGGNSAAGQVSPGLSPFLVNLTTTGTGRVATFGAFGLWSPNPGTIGPFVGPDGGWTGNPPTNINSWNSISGISGPDNMWLVGVFLDAGLPSFAPASRMYTSADYSALSFTDIVLGQVFFIGDGLTGRGNGAVQTFLVPDNATRLYLGVADGPGFQNQPGYYEDNAGSMAVSWDISDGEQLATVPEPVTLLLLGSGLFGVAGARFRRRKKDQRVDA